MTTLFIVPIEKIETRYTKHWFDFIPKQLATYTNFEVRQITLPEGDDAPQNSEGGFFNFGFTCAYKSRQLIEIEKIFDKEVKDGDVFLFTDYWNPAVLFLRYISALKNVNITIVGICHAGLWDPQDMLTKSFGTKPWGRELEKTFGRAYDHLLFATDFSKYLYLRADYSDASKCRATGFPMEYYDQILPDYYSLENPPKKEDIVVFPHRKASEKRLDFFENVAQYVSTIDNSIKFVVALDVCKNKDEYHDLMYRSKVAFSAATQETLGISMGIEAPICGCVPLVPLRLSYQEIFSDNSIFFMDDQDVYTAGNKVIDAVKNYDAYVRSIKLQREISRKWFDGYRFYTFMNSLL